FFFQAEDGIRDRNVTGVQTCALPIFAAYQMKNFEESMGVNDRIALSNATKVMRRRINENLMRQGVTLIDPDTTYTDIDVKVGSRSEERRVGKECRSRWWRVSG